MIMKKLILICLGMFLLTSCGSKTTQQVAPEPSQRETVTTPQTPQETLSWSQDDIEETDIVQEPIAPNPVEITPITENQFIEIDRIDESAITTGSIDITGTTLGTVDKIEVFFHNGDSVYPDDRYTLQTFSPGNETFKYVASSKFQVLDFGTNIYVFKAYQGDAFSETEVIIRAKDPDAETVDFEDTVIGEENSSIDIPLPVSQAFGNPISLGVNSFTYSQINGLEIMKQDNLWEVTCDNLTESLEKTINTWFYWNTCRDTIKDKGISFYVIRLEWQDAYVYEKHYIDYVHGLHTIYEIETWTGVTKDNIAEKNTQLKEENDTFQTVPLVDSLVKTITIQEA